MDCNNVAKIRPSLMTSVNGRTLKEFQNFNYRMKLRVQIKIYGKQSTPHSILQHVHIQINMFMLSECILRTLVSKVNTIIIIIIIILIIIWPALLNTELNLRQ
jgi:hypothetical protein